MFVRAVFSALAASRSAQRFAYRYGMRRQHGLARRFIAGETVADAIAAAQRIQMDGLLHTLDYLGPTAATLAEANRATHACLAMLGELAASGIDRQVSLKPTHFGARIDRATCVDNLRRILDRAAAADFFVQIDMEDSRFTQLTHEVFDTLWGQGYRNIGVALQAYLVRSVADARRLNALGARVRLVKGAFAEPGRIAYRSKARVSRAFLTLMEVLLSEGTNPAIATHDADLIAATQQFARSRGIDASRFEFQMLYGVRRDLQTALHDEGYRVRIYVPFGPEWFPYLMQRLGERPWLVISGVFVSR